MDMDLRRLIQLRREYKLVKYR